MATPEYNEKQTLIRAFKRFLKIGETKTGAIATEAPDLYRLTLPDTDNIIYTCETNDLTAIPGDTPDENEPIWRIKRFITDGNSIEEMPAGDGEMNLVCALRDTYFPPPPYINTFSTLFSTNSYALIGDVPELSFDRLDPFSISVWYKLDAANERILISKQAGSNNAGWRIAIQGGNPRFHLSGGASGDRIEVRCTAVDLNDGIWRHLVFTYDGSSDASGVAVYNDSIENTTPDIIADTLVSSTLNAIDAQISGRNGTTGNFNGNEDQVLVYNRVLTQAEVNEIYGTGEPNDPADHASFSDCVGYWRMGDERDGLDIPDLASGNTATLTNGTEDDFVKDTPP